MPTPRRPRRLLRRIIRSAIAGYLLTCIVVYFIQDRMVFPGAASQGKSDASIIAPPDCQIIHLTTASGDQVAALFGNAVGPAQNVSRPTILYFYGNGGTVAWSMGEFKNFRNLRADVLIPDFVGYGMSGGKPSEVNLYATADASYDYLVHQRGVAPQNLVVVGWSLGAAVAIDPASRRPVGALAIFNAFTTMREMARKTMPWLPTSWILKYRFDNLQKIPTISCPIFICNGVLDQLIPPSMSDRLAVAAKGPVTRLKVPNSGHNEIFSADPDLVYSMLSHFLNNTGVFRPATPAENTSTTTPSASSLP
jgi:fermentation-respiration switch protein FrsA (DUF1100 family)